MHNNTLKRDILIFPKFKNINKIQEIRNKYDRLANLIAPHITLGQSNNIEEFCKFTYEFETNVDEISVELIGEHEESIIVKNLRLGECL